MDRLLFNTEPIKLVEQTGKVEKEHKKYKALLNNIQGNIIKEHGRDYTVNLLLRFKEERSVTISEIKKKIRQFATQITSANQQHQQAAEYRKWISGCCAGEQPNYLFINFLLSAQGYKKLGFSDDELPSDEAFRLGMKEERDWKRAFPQWEQALTAPTIKSLKEVKEKGRRAYLAKTKEVGLKAYEARSRREDPQKCKGVNQNSWDAALNEGIDAMIMLAMDYMSKPEENNLEPAEKDNLIRAALEAQAHKITRPFEAIADIYYEYGFTYYNKDDDRKQRGVEDRKPIEHFGFIDGISNPLFLERDIESARKAEGVVGKACFDKYNPWAPLNLALIQEPKRKAHECGSYMVFLKIEQNVKAFHTSIKKFAKRLGIPEPLAEAFVFGRFRDGTPVALSATSGLPSVLNNFSYINDQGTHDHEGLRCPLHAHMRKTNRRDSYRETRIVRRGITYGSRKRHFDKDTGHLKFNDSPEKDVGLLFMCFQRDIVNQFARIASEWAALNSPRYGIGFDPIIGQINKETGKQNWRDKWGPNPNAKLVKQSFPLEAFVNVIGGEYFFAPSISFLKRL